MKNAPVYTRDSFNSLINQTEAEEYIDAALKASVNNGQLAFIRFFTNYVSWNGHFAGYMTGLASMISAQRELFVDSTCKITALADRSNYVASFVFDTVRDEFNDRGHDHRDTHRCLAQAMVLGMIQYYDLDRFHEQVNEALRPLPMSKTMTDHLREGFMDGAGSITEDIFTGIGFHIGSELLGSLEYTAIDRYLRTYQPDLVKYLESTAVMLNGLPHNCYQWISIHSSLGNDVEDEHFQLALDGVNEALRLATPDKKTVMHYIESGVIEFANHHRLFFKTLDYTASDVLIMKAKGIISDLAQGLANGALARHGMYAPNRWIEKE